MYKKAKEARKNKNKTPIKVTLVSLLFLRVFFFIIYTMSSSSSSSVAETTPVHVFIGQNAGMLVKLLGFSAALFAFPILTFFMTLHSLFDGKEENFFFSLYDLLNKNNN